MARGAELPPREAMHFDVVVVGAGPAGLAAAIRLKQLAAMAGRELSVVVLEKGSQVGAHILSGAVVDPIGLNSLIPNWKAKGAPIETPVSEDRFYYLSPAGALRIPNILMPPLMGNHGNYIVSLGNLTRWLGEQAAEMGVEVFPGFAAAEVLYDEQAAVIGVATGDMGLSKDGKPTDRFTRGMELKGKYTIIAKGTRGSLAKELMLKFDLGQGRQRQKFGHWPEGVVGGAPGGAQAGARAAHTWLAARRSHGRGLVHLPLWRQLGFFPPSKVPRMAGWVLKRWNSQYGER